MTNRVFGPAARSCGPALPGLLRPGAVQDRVSVGGYVRVWVAVVGVYPHSSTLHPLGTPPKPEPYRSQGFQ